MVVGKLMQTALPAFEQALFVKQPPSEANLQPMSQSVAPSQQRQAGRSSIETESEVTPIKERDVGDNTGVALDNHTVNQPSHRSSVQ